MAFNAYADRMNEQTPKPCRGRHGTDDHSSSEFIFKASGIEQRYVIDKSGILDPEVMHPLLRQRSDDEISLMAEMALDACQKALDMAGIAPEEIDLVICAASNLERAYPAVAIEIQKALGAGGFAFDMNVACSSATFGIQAAADMVRVGSAKKAIVVNPEICSAHLEWRDRDCHFIFGDVATATVIERAEDAKGGGSISYQPAVQRNSLTISATTTVSCADHARPVSRIAATCNSCRMGARSLRKWCRWYRHISLPILAMKGLQAKTCIVFGYIRRTSR